VSRTAGLQESIRCISVGRLTARFLSKWDRDGSRPPASSPGSRTWRPSVGADQHDQHASTPLLGADLEEPGDGRFGWSAVVSNPGRPDLRSSVFKVPHHGSATAHHDDTWEQLITPAPYAAATPYKLGGNVLPQSTDITRIRQRAQSAYITKARLYQRARRRSNLVQKLIPASFRAMTKNAWSHPPSKVEPGTA
jgi:hypothetical protein